MPTLCIQCLPFDSLFLLEAEDCKDKITLNEGSLAYCIAIKYCVTLITVLCVFAFWSCEILYDFQMEKMFGSSLPPVVCTRTHVLCTLFVFACVVVSNTYCVVFLCCFPWSCVPYIVSFSVLSIFDCPFNVL
jgi:hypothetical protein